MSFDLFLTILSNIINLVIIFGDLLFFMIIQIFSQMLQGIQSADWVLQRLFGILVGASGSQDGLAGELLPAQG
jgi:hypothetical protein